MGGRRVWLAATVVISILGPPGVALAESRAFEEGLGAFKALDYPQALELLEQSLKGEDLSNPQAAEAARMIAVIHIAYGRTDEAEAAFVRLLGFDPGFKLSASASPDVRKVLKTARRRFKRENPHQRGGGGEAPTESGGRGSESESVTGSGSGSGTGTGTGSDSGTGSGSGSGSGTGSVTVTVTGTVTGPGTGSESGSTLDQLRATVEAEHLAAPEPVPPPIPTAESDLLAALEPSWSGTLDPTEPVEPAESLEPPVYATWWFWTIIGGVVVVSAGAATTAVVLTQPPRADYGPFTLGSP